MNHLDLDLTKLNEDDLRDYMDRGRDEIERRHRVLTEAMNGRPKGPGRPPKNGTRLTAADLEPAD